LPPADYRPHVTLSYKEAPSRVIAIRPIGWRVKKVLLIVSHYGTGRHEVFGRWALHTRQMTLPVAA